MEKQRIDSISARLRMTRRSAVTQLASGLFLCLGGITMSQSAFADELTRTPAQTEGPFYPDHMPLDTDNDLLIVNEEITPAVGEVTHLTGKVLDAKGEPVRKRPKLWKLASRTPPVLGFTPFEWK